MPDTNPNLSNFTELEKAVMFNKATERPFTGEYNDFFEPGVYVCKNCKHLLYTSQNKFPSTCGWPSFDDEAPESIKKVIDSDGYRVEILCNKCGIHLGHVFEGENLTPKNLRHCVNSVSLEFVPDSELAKIYVACGCFWGVQYWFEKLDGVIFTQVGYSGGVTKNPSYEEICAGNTGHYETLEITYQKSKISPKELLQYFFEIHDFEQTNGQGNDIGQQYKSVIFYQNEEEKEIAQDSVNQLDQKGYKVATQILAFTEFYTGEDYHQNYYQKNGKTPYCHFYKTIF